MCKKCAGIEDEPVEINRDSFYKDPLRREPWVGGSFKILEKNFERKAGM